MPVRDFLASVAAIAAVMAAAACIETAVPLFLSPPSRHTRRAANLWLTVLSLVLNWLLSSAAALAAVWWRPAGVPVSIRWPLWAQALTGIIVLDFSVGYLSHRTMHAWPAMWRFHRVHHSDEFVDATTTFRAHPVEIVWRFLFTIVPVWLLGLPALAVIVQRLLQASNGVIEHANVRLWGPLDRMLSIVWVTPNVHKVHHSRAISETNSNYANLLTIYDRLLGTYTPSERAAGVIYGLADEQPLGRGNAVSLLTLPFETRPDAGVPDRKVSSGTGLAR